MNDWKYAQRDATQALARLHLFSAKRHPSGDIDVRITVQEFVSPEIGAFQFVAIADIELNQKVKSFKPVGFSDTLLGALSDCVQQLRDFDYEGAATPQ